MTKAIRFHTSGGPEVLQLDDIQVGDPGPGQVRIRHCHGCEFRRYLSTNGALSHADACCCG